MEKFRNQVHRIKKIERHVHNKINVSESLSCVSVSDCNENNMSQIPTAVYQTPEQPQKRQQYQNKVYQQYLLDDEGTGNSSDNV